MKLCINCIHCEKTERSYFCHAPQYTHRIDLVTGRKLMVLCETMRRMSTLGCGVAGKWFESAESFDRTASHMANDYVSYKENNPEKHIHISGKE